MKGNNFKSGFGILLDVFLALAMISCSSGSDDALPAGGEQDSGFDTMVSYAKAVNTTILSNPTNPSGSTDAAFTFKCNKKKCAYKCLLDSGLWESCKSPKAYSALAEVSHTFKVKAKDKATGKWDRTPATYAWTIDLTAPDTNIISNPTNPTDSSTADFTFSSPDTTATFECQLDSGGFSLCASPRAYFGLTEGAHTFEVRATDLTGNVDPTPASYNWAIDTTPPVTTIDTYPPDPANSASAQFTFSCTDANIVCTFQCQIDSGGWSACTSPANYSDLTEGQHLFEVKATDGAGNPDATPATYSWAVDLIPDTAIISSPPANSNNADASFSFSCTNGPCTYECNLDSAGWTSCASPKSCPGLGQGGHTFQVRAVDATSNTDPTPAGHSWNVDTLPPDTSITSNPPNPDTSLDATFAFSCNEASCTFQCRMDSEAYVACSSPRNYISLEDGTHTFQVQAIDPAGNPDASPAVYVWNIAPINAWFKNTILRNMVPSPRSDHTAAWTGSLMLVWGGADDSSYFNTGGRYDPITDSWTAIQLTGAPAARASHSAIWTGSRMVVWGGRDENGYLDTGGRYDPATDSWAAIQFTGVPAARECHSAVWTGTVMVVWGGDNGTPLDTGGRYDPANNYWTATSTTNAPNPRYSHSAVWASGLATPVMIVWGGYGDSYLNTGGRYDPVGNSWTATSLGANLPGARYFHTAIWSETQMIVWGGFGGSYLNTGGRYDPAANSWTATSTTGAPVARAYHTAVWTGTQMIAWGGSGTSPLNTGGRYDPAANSWTATQTVNAPAIRGSHTAVWAGTKMIVWGGYGGSYLNSGGRYDPAANTWAATSTTNSVPAGRYLHTAIWSGTQIIIWGGYNDSCLNSGGRYDPVTDSWTAIKTTGAPAIRESHTAVWSGTVMVVWGGYNGSAYLNTGGRYDPATDSWSTTKTTNAPSIRAYHSAVWTGTQMLVWGGYGGSYLNNGARYNPTTDLWYGSTTVYAASPAPRESHSAVWTGTLMIVWGGADGSSYMNSGGRYNLGADTWTAISTVNAPTARKYHAAVWDTVNSQMIVWGGWDGIYYYDTGGRYNPAGDAWLPTATANAPISRAYHTAVWTGTKMIVWGGMDGVSYFNTGGRYDPAGDAWLPTAINANEPSPRASHTAVWTGTKMIIWGGTDGKGYFNDGGRYWP